MKYSISRKAVFLSLAALLIFIIFYKTFSLEKKYEASFLKLGTVVTVICYAEKDIDFSKLSEDLSRKLEEMEKIFSVHDKDSEISYVNHMAGKGPVDVSSPLWEVICFSKELWSETEKRFDPTVYPLLQKWNLTDFEGDNDTAIPEKTEIDRMLLMLSMEKVILENGKVAFANETLSLDLGGIAKGFIIDELVEIVKKDPAVKAGIVNIGGDLRAFIKDHKRLPFRIGIRDPRKKDSLTGYVEIDNGSIVTSGGYERYRKVEKKKYIHIIDPVTGYPVDNGTLSVTVMGESAMRCDGLATAYMILGPEGTEKVLKEEKILFEVERDGKADTIFLNGFELRKK